MVAKTKTAVDRSSAEGEGLDGGAARRIAVPLAVDVALLLAVLSRRATRGRWPLPAAALLAAAAGALLLVILSFKTTEFGPLGMLFVNLFAAPPLLVLPALVRVAAAGKIKPRVARLQYAAYGLVAVAWIAFAIRPWGP